MNALDIMRAALRPHGLLLDIRPTAHHSPVEVRVGERIIPLGQLDESRHFLDVHTADTALQAAIDARWFQPEAQRTFPFIYHFDSVDAWLEFMAERWQKADIHAEIVARARALLAPSTAAAPEPAGEVRVLREIGAARLRRL